MRGTLFAVIAGSSLTLSVITVALAEDAPRRVLLRVAPEASAPSPSSTSARVLPAFVVTPAQADPPPTRTAKMLVFDLKYDRGEVLLLGERSETLSAPIVTPRVMGRFALELYEGPALVERVRFDFPLLGASLAEAGPLSESRLDARLTSAIGVRFPALSRGTRLELVDRKTNARWSLPWRFIKNG